MLKKILSLFSINKKKEISNFKSDSNSDKNESPFIKDEDFYLLAFEQITKDIVFDNAKKEDVYSTLFNNCDSSYNAIKSLKDMNLKFKWPWFDNWLMFFKQYGDFPYLWKKEISKTTYYIKNIDDACKVLTIKDMKTLLQKHGVNHIPRVKKNELQAFFKKNIQFSDIQKELDVIVQKKYGWDVDDPYQNLKITLLKHSISFRASELRRQNFYKQNNWGTENITVRFSFVNDGCIENDIVTNVVKPRYENGRYIDLPPYFPGSRCMIFYIRERHDRNKT